MRIPPDPAFMSYVTQRNGLTAAQFAEKWQQACGWLSAYPVNFNDPKATSALQLYTHHICTTQPETSQAFRFCANEFVMALL